MKVVEVEVVEGLEGMKVAVKRKVMEVMEVELELDVRCWWWRSRWSRWSYSCGGSALRRTRCS